MSNTSQEATGCASCGMDPAAGQLANPMLGSQLVGKSILAANSKRPDEPKEPQVGAEQASKAEASVKLAASGQHQVDLRISTKQETQLPAQQLSPSPPRPTVDTEANSSSSSSNNNNNNNNNSNSNSNNNSNNNSNSNNNNNINDNSGGGQKLNKTVICQAKEAQVQQVEHRPLETKCTNLNSLGTAKDSLSSISSRDFELLTKETQELKMRTRKLQLEIDEKNEIIIVLKDELETTKEQNDKFQRENIQLLKDSKRVKFLQDENDFLQDKVSGVEKLEVEIKRLKEKLAELDFLKLRIAELEEDLAKAREEGAQYEAKLEQADARLTRLSELVVELDKWKSFSQELESERNLIQGKLLESIEQETKLNSINKKVEDEVKRLRSLIKTYEERLDEEQASNSLIMSVADLKQLNGRTSQEQSDSIIDQSSSANGDTSIKFELDKQAEKEINEENRKLKQKLDEQDAKLLKLTEMNEKIRAELEGSKRLVTGLRQDLACEKSLASKLTNQLTSFTKQIKSLDKQYFPMHGIQKIDREIPHEVSKNKNETPIAGPDKRDESKSVTPTCSDDAVPAGPNPDFSLEQVDRSHTQQKEQHQSPVEVDTCANSSSIQSTFENRCPVDPTKRLKSSDAMELTASDKSETHKAKQAEDQFDSSKVPAVNSELPVPAASKHTTPNSFVRNSLPSRSVNFGHSRSSAYLDRIRASVTATTTTNTTSSFSEQTRNIVVNQQRHEQRPTGSESHYVLNCMLEHSHSERCFVDKHQQMKSHVQPSQVTPSHGHPIDCVPVQSSRQLNALIDPVSHDRLMMTMYQQQACSAPISQQQQLSLTTNSLPRPYAAPSSGNSAGLTDEQIAHIANLHHQHYHHHLQHMHQLHQLHHQHHLLHHHRLNGHKYPQPRVADENGLSSKAATPKNQMAASNAKMAHTSVSNQSSSLNPLQRPFEAIYSGGSQFYAQCAQFDQVYENISANNGIEQTSEHHFRPNLVNNNGGKQHRKHNDQGASSLRSSPARQMAASRSSPIRVSHQHIQHQQICNQYSLPQIDEVNGNPKVDPIGGQHINSTSVKQNQGDVQALIVSDHQKSATRDRHNGTPLKAPLSSSSSPTSSTTSSSNSSPSSASSSSSLSSLSASTVPLNRSSTRQTTTDLNRRQLTIERDLVGTLPVSIDLSRAGSFRVNKQSNNTAESSHKEFCRNRDEVQMRTPVKSQQPPMRTSKILTISNQQQIDIHQRSIAVQHGQQQHRHHHQLLGMQHLDDHDRRLNQEGKRIDKLSDETVNIKMHDASALAPMRAPKSNHKPPGGSSAISSNINVSNNQVGQSSRIATKKPLSCSNLLEGRSRLSNGRAINDNGNNKSSVWFEYGCV